MTDTATGWTPDDWTQAVSIAEAWDSQERAAMDAFGTACRLATAVSSADARIRALEAACEPFARLLPLCPVPPHVSHDSPLIPLVTCLPDDDPLAESVVVGDVWNLTALLARKETP